MTGEVAGPEERAGPRRAERIARTVLFVAGWVEVAQVVGSLVFWGRDSLLMAIGAMIVPALVAIACFIGARRLSRRAATGIFASAAAEGGAQTSTS